MRLALFLLFTVFSISAAAETDDAYIILKASFGGPIGKPTGICMARKTTCLHIPADEPIVSIAPGTYTVRHVDFANAPHNGLGVQSTRDPIKVTLKSGKIYFIGELRVSKRVLRKYKMTLNQDLALIHQACESSPEIFKRYPLTNVINQKEVNFDCSNEEEKDT